MKRMSKKRPIVGTPHSEVSVRFGNHQTASYGEVCEVVASNAQQDWVTVLTPTAARRFADAVRVHDRDALTGGRADLIDELDRRILAGEPVSKAIDEVPCTREEVMELLWLALALRGVGTKR